MPWPPLGPTDTCPVVAVWPFVLEETLAPTELGTPSNVPFAFTAVSLVTTPVVAFILVLFEIDPA
jgi:hypothetical protein